MADHRASRADLVTGALLFVLSVAIIYASWTMDRLEIRQIHPLSVPGLLPGILGLALAVCSLVLIAQAIRARGVADRPVSGNADVSEQIDRGALGRLMLAGALCLAYALGLVGRVPFWLATAAFVTAFILIFEWREAASNRLSSVAWALGIGLVTGIGVAYAFSELFLVRLP
jgi:putative tricarboxylic transport membrane protein